MAYLESLQELASAYSISTSYQGFGGETIEVSGDTLIKTLRSLGVRFGNEPVQDSHQPSYVPIVAPAPSEEEVLGALRARQEAEFARLLPRTVVGVQGTDTYFEVHVHDGAPAELTLTLEDGQVVLPTQVENWTPPRTIDGVTYGEATFRIAADTPLGWHTLTIQSEDRTASCAFIQTPAKLSTTEALLERPAAGVMAQLYSVRSRDSWGIGDFHDLGTLAALSAQEAHSDFLLINPLHAAQPFPPIEDSPYLPTTRRFINPLYIRVEDIPEFIALPEDVRAEVAALAAPLQAMNLTADTIERNPIYTAKLQVLREIYAMGRDEIRERDFQDFCECEGRGLEAFALWCATQEAQQEDENAHAVADHPAELMDFYKWLQWICDQQLAAAQSRALAAGMRFGIMADLAVGVHPGGADAQILSDVLAPTASVGAPPDNYNQQGQDWSQPPWHPDALAEVGYQPWRDLLTTVLRHAGGIRVDHILGLFRLFWIPRMQGPATGTYVNYDHHALVGILALEAERAGAIVVGEDLGTFEPWVQEFLAERGILGTSVLWFEGSPNGGPRHQHEYRTHALSAVTTHDLPPTAGYLQGEHITLRDRLGILSTDAAQEDAEDLQWQAEILDRVAGAGCFDGSALNVPESFVGCARGDRGETTELVAAMHRFIAGSPSVLTCAALVDLVGDRRAQNQPGTTNDMYPNWCVPLTDANGEVILLEDVATNATFQKVAAAARR